MLFSGILTAFGLVAITAKFSRSFLEKVLGYDWIFDIVITLGLPLIFYGTYSGMMTAVVTGLSISLMLWISKNLLGYQKLSRNGKKFIWTRSNGIWTPAYIGEKLYNLFKVSFSSSIDGFRSGWSNAAIKATV